MIQDKEKLVNYLNASINGIFKILPLYEEKNIGVETYIDSLLFTLYGLDKVMGLEYNKDYIDVLATLESVKKEIKKENSSHAVMKRETFKCINIVKNMVVKLEEDD